MCSASMGAEGSVTLQLREAIQAPDSAGGTLDGSLTIGYPDSEMLADMLGSIQAAGKFEKKILILIFISKCRAQDTAQFFNFKK